MARRSDVRRQPKHVRVAGDRVSGGAARLHARRDAVGPDAPPTAEFRTDARVGGRRAPARRAAARSRRRGRRRHRAVGERTGVRMPDDPAVDVVTVGAGWTAGILAWKLTAAGHSVVSLEQGDNRWTFPDFAMDHDPEAYVIRKKMMIDISKTSWTWRPNPTLPSLPMRQYGSFHPGAGLGGSAAHWSAQLWRFL